MVFNSPNGNQPNIRQFSVWGIIMIIVGMFVFVFGGLAPIFTGEIFHMFIFIGIGFFLFICGGILIAVKIMQFRKQLLINPDIETGYGHSQYPNEDYTYPEGYNFSRGSTSHSEYRSSFSSSQGKPHICQQCGSTNTQGHKYCSTCGSQLL